LENSATKEAQRLRGTLAKEFGFQPPADEVVPVKDNNFLNKAKEFTPIIDEIFRDLSAEIHAFDTYKGVTAPKKYSVERLKVLRAICNALPCCPFDPKE
jgi:hypothetical protein